MSAFTSGLRRWSGPMLGVALLAAGHGTAFADSNCPQDAVQGIWQVYTLSIFQGQTSWTRCVLDVDEKGVFASPSKCTGQQGGDMPAGGKISVVSETACTFNGFISYGNVRNTMVQTAMNRHGDRLDGVGTFPGGQFMLKAIKRFLPG